ncbi:cation:dicarboxylate symporter family transporter [candidate division KSB1 bacterium]
MKLIRNIPAYVWTILALVLGITLGGFFSQTLEPVASGTTAFIKFIVYIVPVLIFAALSPAFAVLVKRGLAGKFAVSVILWFVLTSTIAAFFGLVISSLVFSIPFSTMATGVLNEIVKMFDVFLEKGGASLPLIAIFAAVIIGLLSVRIRFLFSFLSKIQETINKAGQTLGLILVPIIFCLGITLGVKFGAKLGMEHFLTITLYTFLLCTAWSIFYILVIIKLIAKRNLKSLMTQYYIPTAVFAAGTVSSLATFPVNITNIKKYGVRPEIADFVISFGAVTNMNGSALINIAFAPFILHYIFGIDISLTMMLFALPAIVVFTIAAPGLPAGMGTALWTSTLFASMLGLEEPVRSTLITTWVALYGGLPDMFITAVNCTGDGFSAVLFDSFFSRFSKAETKKMK